MDMTDVITELILLERLAPKSFQITMTTFLKAFDE